MLIDILSRGPQLYSTQSLLKAAQVRGHQVQIIDHSKCHLLVGDQKDIQIYYEGQVHKLPQAVIPRIGASITSHGADVIRHLQQSGKVYCLTGAEALLLARDKFRSLQLLAGAGLPVPRSLVYGQIANPSLAIEFLGGFPMVFKLMESTHGAGVILIHSLSALETTIQHFSRTGVRFMLQEFIEEAGGGRENFVQFGAGGRGPEHAVIGR